MAAICGFLTFISILGVFASVIWMLIQLVRRKNLKVPMIVICSFIGMIIIFSIVGATSYKTTRKNENVENQEIKEELLEQKEQDKLIETSSESQTNAIIEESEQSSIQESEIQSEVQSSIIQDEIPSEEESVLETIEVNKYSEELEKYSTGEYCYIAHSDLVKYHTNLVGQKFYTIITVDELDGKVIKSNLDDGYMMSTFNCIKDYSYDLKEQDAVSIMGVVGGYDSYGFVGKSLKFDDCMVFSVGKDAREYSMDKSDEYFNVFFTVTEEVAKSNNEITEDEFKNLCERLNYEDILRNPNSYKDKYCKLSGTVLQVIEGWFGSYTIYIKDSNGDIWGCAYSYDENESHLLDGDKVTVYGMCDGTANTKTVLGKQVTMPYVEIEYID